MPPEKTWMIDEKQLAAWREHNARKVKENALRFLSQDELSQQDEIRDASVAEVRVLLDAIVKLAEEMPQLTVRASVLEKLFLFVDRKNHKEEAQDADDRLAVRPAALAKVREETRLKYGCGQKAKLMHQQQIASDRAHVDALVNDPKVTMADLEKADTDPEGRTV